MDWSLVTFYQLLEGKIANEQLSMASLSLQAAHSKAVQQIRISRRTQPQIVVAMRIVTG